MKIDEFGVGRITAQNTTKDVKPDETKRQAKKIGLLHPTAAKNSDPNTLFNLGINELRIEKPDPKDTLGVKRKDMPQIKSDDYAEFISYLKKNGATFTKETIPARELKAMQKEFSDEGILKQMMKNIKQGPNRKAVIASSDDYILDGHHRWLVAVNTGDDLNVYRVNMPAWQLYDLVNKFEKTYYKDIYERGSIGIPFASGLVMKLFPHLPLKIKPSTPGKLRYDEDITQADIDQLEVFADKLFAKVGIDVEFTRHFLDRVNDERNKKPITMAELTRLFKQEFKRYGKPIAQLGPDQEAVMKDLQTDINLPFALRYDRENNELDLIAKTVMRKKDFKTPNREFNIEGWSKEYKDSINCNNPKGFSQRAHCASKKKNEDSKESFGSRINFPGYDKPEKDKPNKYKPIKGKDKTWSEKLKGFFTDDIAEAQVEEGVNDPHIFKAVFLAGGPGSGKSFVANNILGGTGLRPVNSDDLYEFLMSKQGLALDPETIASPQGQEIRARAKELTGSRKAMYLDGRLGLIIDGTGKNVGKYQKQAEALKSLGYDTMMIFVNTSLEVAQQRNMKRARKLRPEMVKDMWNEVQQNLMKFQQVFGAGRFHIIDNSGGLEDLDRKENFDKVYVETQRFLNTPPSKRAAQVWIQKQKEQNDEKRSAKQPQQQNQQSDGRTTTTD